MIACAGSSSLTVHSFQPQWVLPGEVELAFGTRGSKPGRGHGKTTTAFEWQGKRYALETMVEGDWFDLNAAKGLNEIIKKRGNGKQLYFANLTLQ
jgi:hypothetical protein